MSLTEKTCSDFLTVLASEAPVPGGGGAAALGGALGMALSNMVGNLTVGKKKYADHRDEIQGLLEKGTAIMKELKKLVDQDGDVFLSLLQAFALPKSTAAETGLRETAIEERAKAAAVVPIEIMRFTLEGMKIQYRMAQIGTVTAASDNGCGAAFLQAAIISGEFNVMANLRIIKDKEFISKATAEINSLREEGLKIADETLKLSMAKLKR